MKILHALLFTTLAGLAALANTIPPHYYGDRISALPLQAGTCDIIGVGRVTNSWNDGITLSVDNYWYGDPGSNSLSVAMHGYHPPVTNTPLVFFLSKYSSFLAVEPETLRYFLIFKMNDYRPDFRADGLWFLNNRTSWFHVNETNASMVTYASNLVHAVQSSNTNQFYQIIRDGLRFNPPDSRIYKDSELAFTFSKYYMTTNFMQQIWADPLLPMPARAWVKMNYRDATRLWLE